MTCSRRPGFSFSWTFYSREMFPHELWRWVCPPLNCWFLIWDHWFHILWKEFLIYGQCWPFVVKRGLLEKTLENQADGRVDESMQFFCLEPCLVDLQGYFVQLVFVRIPEQLFTLLHMRIFKGQTFPRRMCVFMNCPFPVIAKQISTYGLCRPFIHCHHHRQYNYWCHLHCK